MDFLISTKDVLINFMNFLTDKVNTVNTFMWSYVLIVLLIEFHPSKPFV